MVLNIYQLVPLEPEMPDEEMRAWSAKFCTILNKRHPLYSLSATKPAICLRLSGHVG